MSEEKTKAELETENAELQAENDRLRVENATCLNYGFNKAKHDQLVAELS